MAAHRVSACGPRRGSSTDAPWPRANSGSIPVAWSSSCGSEHLRLGSCAVGGAWVQVSICAQGGSEPAWSFCDNRQVAASSDKGETRGMRSIRHQRAVPLTALGSAVLLSMAQTAQAEPPVGFSAGLMLSISLGQKAAFGMGLDLRITTRPDDIQSCGPSGMPGGLGAFAQATWLMYRGARFAAGFHGGGEFARPGFALDAELGWTYRTRLDAEHPGQHGVHLGVLTLLQAVPDPLLPTLEYPVRVAFPVSGGLIRVPEITQGLGMRVPSLFGAVPAACYVDGRALRSEHGIHLPPSFVRGEQRPRSLRLDDFTRQFLSDTWLEQARAECASIPAFIALARDLASVGAPSELVVAALAAAWDEVHHTELCRTLSADLSGLDRVPLLYEPAPPRRVPRRDALLRLAIESYVDGILGEGAAAEYARQRWRVARDAVTRAALAKIAQDEQRHADLAWSVLQFCLSAGGTEVADALAELLREGPAPCEDPVIADRRRSADNDTCWAHGRLSPLESEACWRGVAMQAQQRARSVLRAKSRATATAAG